MMEDGTELLTKAKTRIILGFGSPTAEHGHMGNALMLSSTGLDGWRVSGDAERGSGCIQTWPPPHTP